MNGPSPLILTLSIVGGVLALLTTILVVVSSLVGRAVRRRVAGDRAALASEGVVRESAWARGSIRYREFRGPGFYASRTFSSAGGQLLLTRQTFSVLGTRLRRVPLTDLRRSTVTAAGGRLVVAFDDPPGYTGHMEIHLRLDDADSWVQALREAGAG